MEIQKIAAALVKAQKSKDFESEARLMKAYMDATHPIKRVNAKSALQMPERFYSKLVFGASDCWIWRGHVDDVGYGRFPYRGENKAHRVSYVMHKGEIPEGHLVMHSCDNRQCVNPNHLSIGTQKENMQDMARKGRGKSPALNGEKNPMSKLTTDKVSAIRDLCANGHTQSKVAKEFNVSPMTVSRIVRKELWK